MPNAFSRAGMNLMNVTREDTGFDISLRRDNEGVLTTIGPFRAKSSPIGHALLTETGIDLSEHYRSLYFKASYTGELGEPRRGDIIIDEDDTEWILLPMDGDKAWRWHGSEKTAYRVLTKKDA